MSATKLKILKGYDFHCHFRRPVVKTAVELTAECFCGAVAMGNTDPPIAIADDALLYEREIRAALPFGCAFQPIMTIMLTKMTTPQIVIDAARRGIKVVKYIPEGVSVNSKESVALEKLSDYFPVLEAMQENDMVFSGHWESLHDSKGRELEELDREEAAIPFLDKVVKTFPTLRIVAEHASTKKLIDYVRQSPLNLRATLTMHHALLTFCNVCSEPGVITNPYNYCKPIAKTEEDRQAVERAMVSGDPHFFPGSDMAPHPLSAKQKIPPVAGIFCPGKIFVPLMLEIFLANNALQNLSNFYENFGAEFYGLPKSLESLELTQEDWTVPPEYDGIVPFMAGQTLHWKVAD